MSWLSSLIICALFATGWVVVLIAINAAQEVREEDSVDLGAPEGRWPVLERDEKDAA